MKPVLITISANLNCRPEIVFDYFYNLDLFFKWYNDPGNFEVKAMNDYQFQDVGYKQHMIAGGGLIEFYAEVLEVSKGNYVKGKLWGFFCGTFSWEFYSYRNGCKIIKDFYITGSNWLKHYLVKTNVTTGDKIHFDRVFKRLKKLMANDQAILDNQMLIA